MAAAVMQDNVWMLTRHHNLAVTCELTPTKLPLHQIASTCPCDHPGGPSWLKNNLSPREAVWRNCVSRMVSSPASPCVQFIAHTRTNRRRRRCPSNQQTSVPHMKSSGLNPALAVLDVPQDHVNTESETHRLNHCIRMDKYLRGKWFKSHRRLAFCSSKPTVDRHRGCRARDGEITLMYSPCLAL
jgi:hypothetical protein